jgi:hypothetical protein
MRQSLLNTPTPVYHGPAHSLYGERGPVQAQNTGRQRKPLSGAPESIQHHIDDCLAHVADLSGRQKTALRAEIGKMLNDIRFLRMLTDEAKARGRWSQAAVQDHSEGTLPPY